MLSPIKPVAHVPELILYSSLPDNWRGFKFGDGEEVYVLYQIRFPFDEEEEELIISSVEYEKTCYPHLGQKKFTTPGGNKGIVCPAQRFENIKCNDCLKCDASKPGPIIGFIDHGPTSKVRKKISAAYSK